MMSRAWCVVALFLLPFVAQAQTPVECDKAIDPANATYVIEGDAVTLVNGARSRPVEPGSHTMHDTHLTGAQACGSFDGENVVLVLLRDDPGGSGTYYYVAAVPKDGRSYPAVLLGDRIVPTSIAIEHGQIVVTYLERPADAPMAAAPSVKTMRRFGLQHQHLVDER